MANSFHLPDKNDSEEIPALADKQTREQDAEQIRLDFIRSKKLMPEPTESEDE